LTELHESIRAAMRLAELDIDFMAASPDEVTCRLAWDARLRTAGGIRHGGVPIAPADGTGGCCAYLNLPEGASGTATIESKPNLFAAVRSRAR
jgi:acyl-coenzyme A thioesterase PaaI-like protein